MVRFTILAALFMGAALGLSEAARSRTDLFSRGNLVAWCIVPFDAKNRGPEERAEMMARLGIRQFAYDWREQHLPLLDRELDALKKHRIRLTAFWFPSSLEPEKDANVRRILDFLERRRVKTQLWLSLGIPEQNTSPEQRLEMAAKPIAWIADEARKIGCQVALYNHGGWFGEPENQVEVIKRVNRRNVGIVYNFHHGHHRIDDFARLFPVMKPYLIALNINGMRKEGPKILSLGRGDRETEMLRVVRDSGWRGPIGILGHREEMDAEVALRENLEGLATLAAAFGSR